MRSNFEASYKQRSFFRSLTNDELPRKCSKSQASRLIQKALKGEIARRREVVRVFALRFTGTMDMMTAQQTGQPLPVRYTIEVDRMPGAQFATMEEAIAVAQAKYDNPEQFELIIERGVTRDVYVD